MSARPRYLEIAAFSHAGLKREANEDCLCVGDWTSPSVLPVPHRRRVPLTTPCLLAVADGMGGHAKGDVASRMTIEHLSREAGRIDNCDGVRGVLAEAHAAVLDRAAQNATDAGMGSTVVGAVFRETDLLWFNVGDSRLYRRRDGLLRLVSFDDVPETERATSSDVRRQSSLITAAIGGVAGGPALSPHCGIERLTDDACWLLCSDGLTDTMSNNQLEALFELRPLDTVLALVEAAFAAGAPDNISVIVAQVVAGND